MAPARITVNPRTEAVLIASASAALAHKLRLLLSRVSAEMHGRPTPEVFARLERETADAGVPVRALDLRDVAELVSQGHVVQVAS